MREDLERMALVISQLEAIAYERDLILRVRQQAAFNRSRSSHSSGGYKSWITRRANIAAARKKAA